MFLEITVPNKMDPPLPPDVQRTCPTCNKRWPADQDFCGRDGTKLPMPTEAQILLAKIEILELDIARLKLKLPPPAYAIVDNRKRDGLIRDEWFDAVSGTFLLSNGTF